MDTRIALLPNPLVLGKLTVIPQDKGFFAGDEDILSCYIGLQKIITRLLKVKMAPKMMTPPPPI